MSLQEFLRLSHRELVTHRTHSRATIAIIGIAISLLLAALLMTQGLRNHVLSCADQSDDGSIYIAVFDTTTDTTTDATTNATTDSTVPSTASPTPVAVLNFTSVEDAYRFSRSLKTQTNQYDPATHQITELFGNQLQAYRLFHDQYLRLIRPICITLAIIVAIVVTLTLAHALSYQIKTSALYRTTGASRTQLYLLSLAYLIAVIIRALLLAVLMALTFAALTSVIAQKSLIDQLTPICSQSSTPIFLIGLGWPLFAALAATFVSPPLALILCADQFTDRNLALNLKKG